MRMRFITRVNIILIIVSYISIAQGQIENTPHDLSAIAGGNACSFCHTPHGAISGTPLWNHQLSDAVYKIYQSSSLEASVGQPTGSSKLCLSCHDGTVALTESLSNGGTSGAAYIQPGASNLGTDLSDDHPISFVYSESLAIQDVQLRSPLAIPEQLKLDQAGELQCTTCHDAHNNQYGKFLVMPNRQSELCVSCHNLNGWMSSIHSVSSAFTPIADDSYLQNSEYVTVSANGCLNCHKPHSAGGHERLLHFAKSEDNCLNCHNGSVAQTNIKADISKLSRHDVTKYEGIHDIEESPTSSTEHVECVDCHNPHAIENIQAKPPVVPGVMKGVSGVTILGSPAQQAQFEYEVCFKCHGDNPNRIQSTITRQITQTNTRLEFDPSGPSYHPVASPGVNQNIPSLIPPLTVASVIYCIDCHNSDSTSNAGGPHGSIYQYLLTRRYETSDFTQESSFSYELCYKCHSRNSILNDESFPKHKEHLNEQIPCSACHDPHGISAAQGTKLNNSHLINFDISIVQADPATGRLEYEETGLFHGRCYLKCHNVTHSPKEY